MKSIPLVALVLAPLAACFESPQGDADPGGLPDRVTFAGHVAAIVYENCASCHRPGGHAPFNLLGYEDMRQQGPALVVATQARRMPPWLPEPGQFAFAGDPRLSARDISLIERWVAQGMPAGDTALAPPAPTWNLGWPLGSPDLVVTMPDAFRVPASGPDRFRNFVIPVPISSPRWVRAVDLQPGDRRAVHHAIINIDLTRSSRRLDARDPELGFDGMFSSGDARAPEGFFLGWTPGKTTFSDPEGMAWHLEPGTDLVLQLHLRPRGVETTVRAAIGLYFTDEPPTQLSYWISLGSRRIDIPADEADYVVEDSYVLPVPAEVFGIYPHAHFLGKEIEGSAQLADGKSLPLLNIGSWNFNQQDFYRYAEPVALAAGTRLRMRISFDNSESNPLNPNDPPTRVTYGPASNDEMANLFIQLLVRDSVDLQTLAQDFSLKHRRDRQGGLEFLVERFPTNPAYHSQLAQALHSQGQLEEAKRRYRRALQLRPSYAEAQYGLGTVLHDEGDLADAAALYASVILNDSTHVPARYNLGTILHTEGSVPEAVEQYLEVIRLEPTHANAHNNLGNALIELGRPNEAIPYFERALALNPRHADALNNLGSLYRELGRLKDAIAQYRLAVEARPGHGLARFNLGQALIEADSIQEGLDQIRRATVREPDWPVSWATLAWTLATHPDDAVRDPIQALEDATHAAEMTDYGHPVVLDALAAAYAAQGQFDRAVETAQRGIEIAVAQGEEGLARGIRSRFELYQQGKAFRTKHRP